MTTFPDLPSFLRFLEARGDLRRVKARVDARLEVAEIAVRVVREKGPALLFENVDGAEFPLLLNLLGTEKRIEGALGRPPGEVGEELRRFAEDMAAPRLGALWKHRNLLWRGLRTRPRHVADGPVLEHSSAPNLDKLPVLTCWPKDGGRFLTYPLVFTQSPVTGKRNVGVYRMHVHSKDLTGMHWQIQKGGGFHYDEAERRGQALPLATVLGTDPLLMLAGVLPLPEGMDEVSFAAFLRGAPTEMVRLANGLDVPARAEMALEGEVPPVERHEEGPFGDHFGHYSHAAPFPVFHVKKFHHRRGAVYPAAVVGKPPQEDKWQGDAAQEMLLPLLKLMRPELVNLWAYYETGFHNLAVASVRQRYKKEAVKTALSLLGEGQLSLTKCVILVDPDVNVRRFPDVLDALRRNFDPKDDFLLLPGTAQDTLDFTSFTMNLGSKMVLDATSDGAASPSPGPPSLAGINPGTEVEAHRVWRDALLVVKTRGEGRPLLERLVKDPALAGFRLIAAVSADVPLDDDVLLLWGIFTRFDCARDVVPARASFHGGWPVYEGPLGFDATWKAGYPEPLVMDPAVVEKVTRRWNEYGLGL